LNSTFSEGDLLCGRFRVERFIASGGMGELYAARDLELNEQVALKTIRSDIAADERIAQRFRREVQLARRVTHPNICRIFDLFQHHPAGARTPVDFITMELLEGETLAERLHRAGRYSPEEALPIVSQLASALAAAHAVGVVHRDLKTSNVMLLPARGSAGPRAVITDFGIAHRLKPYHDGHVTTALSGEVFGTPDYMAPEQIEGGAITPATDIYSFGIVIYEMLTGVRPFSEDTPIATALRRVSGPPPRTPRELIPELPPSWDAVVMRCLARQPQRRFPDAAAIPAALAGEASAHRAHRHTVLATVVAVAGVLALGAALWSDLRGSPEPGETPAATAAGSPAPRRAVAVLGFRNLANRDDAQWLSTAFAEMLATELSAGESLRTIPGENISRMKVELGLQESDAYGPETLSRIRRNLGTDLIVFGSYTAVGEGANETVRFDIRLQNPRDEESMVLVSETGRADELFEVVSRAGRRLRERLAVAPTPADVDSVRAARPRSAESARLYAEGLDRLRRFDALAARTVLEQAIARDPEFPLAHAALGSAWDALGYDARALESARRAFELSARLPRADRLAVEGTYRELATSWADAIRIWDTLSTFFPDDVEYTLRLANAQISSGAPRDAIATIERFRRQFPDAADPRLDLAESNAAETLSDFKRAQAAATQAGAAAEALGANLLVAAARLRAGAAALRQGQRDSAVASFSQARELYASAGDRAGVARALNNLASAIGDGPDTQKTTALYEEGLAIARSVGEQDLVARLLNNLAIQHRRAGSLQTSLRLNEESLAIRRQIGDRTNIAISLNNIGNVLLDLGDLARASQHYEESAAMSREIGDRRGVARALHNAAESLKLQGEVARARTTNEEALAIRRTIDDPASLATSLYGLGTTLALQGDFAGATRLLNEGLAIDRKLERLRPIAYTEFQLGEMALMSGNLAEARRRHQDALDLRVKLGEQGTAAESRTALAILALEEGRAADADQLVREAIPVFESQKAADNEAMARGTLARAMLAANRPGDARREAERAARLVDQSQNVLVRIPVAIDHAVVTAADDPTRSQRALQALAAEAARRSLARYEFDARRALADVERQMRAEGAAARLAALRAAAKARGFGLYTR
jgi:tetratricopeptide (TPR) repeat protein